MLQTAINILLMLGAFVMMEGVAYVTHKYIMHGWLWALHKSHHRPRKGMFEKNDWFVFYFASPSILFIWLGVNVWAPLLWVGLGMTAYGFAYFIFHDGIVHRRLPFRYRGKNPYMRRIIEAHWVHHATTTKENCVSFGFLYARRPAHELQAAASRSRAA
ncbi:MAG: sterol desaturase family protein [Gammaproteobacteria bacterium]|nr:sterol desaturase family protein [Gammaproteobacteria bacterium]